jgi:hypothetical protein
MLIGIVVIALLFAEALSMSAGVDSREPVGDDHARPVSGGSW